MTSTQALWPPLIWFPSSCFPFPGRPVDGLVPCLAACFGLLLLRRCPGGSCRGRTDQWLVPVRDPAVAWCFAMWWFVYLPRDAGVVLKYVLRPCLLLMGIVSWPGHRLWPLPGMPSPSSFPGQLQLPASVLGSRLPWSGQPCRLSGSRLGGSAGRRGRGVLRGLTLAGSSRLVFWAVAFDLLSPSQKAELGHRILPVSGCPVNGVDPQSLEGPSERERDT